MKLRGSIKVTNDTTEDEMIEIKDSVLNDGFKSGVQMAISKAIDMGKAVQGIFTGNFESISQIKAVIQSGGLLDTISKLWPEWVSDKDRTVMQFLADMCKSMNNAGYLTINDLYTKDEYFSKSPRIRRVIETKKIELKNKKNFHL